MTDGWLMDADCIHGEVWFECGRCCAPEHPSEPLAAAQGCANAMLITGALVALVVVWRWLT